jgi:hypothetical protein
VKKMEVVPEAWKVYVPGQPRYADIVAEGLVQKSNKFELYKFTVYGQYGEKLAVTHDYDEAIKVASAWITDGVKP